MDKDTTKTTFFKVFEAFPLEKFLQIVASAGCDRYVKKLKTLKLLYLMLIAQFLGLDSLRDIATRLTYDKQLQKLLHLTSISASTLSRRLRNIDHRVWEQVFAEVKRQIWQQANKTGAVRQYQLNVIDSSTITLCLRKYLWADYRKTKSGIKLHQRITIHDGNSYPDSAVLTSARKADKTVMDELVVTSPDALNVFDRGYVDYAKWDDYCRKGIRFVSRLKSNAIIDVLEEKSVETNQVLAEKIVRLGNAYTTQMTHPVRLIETCDNQGNAVIIVTNDLTLPAQEISDIYRMRWQIELFFKWIKQHLVVKEFFGTSQNAVYGQIWLALIGYCLLQNLQQKLPKSVSLLEVLRAVQMFLYQAFNELVAALSRPPTKISHGRQSLAAGYDQLIQIIDQLGTDWLDIVDEGVYL